MEFLKHKWGYFLLLLAVLGFAAAVWYLLFWAEGGEPHAGGMLVRAVGKRILTGNRMSIFGTHYTCIL